MTWPVRRGKFNNRKTVIDGFTFDSAKEARRYQELTLLEKAGEVEAFVCQPVYELTVNGSRVGRMTLDFEVIWANGEITCEDVKGGRATKTEAYSLRKRVFEACHAPLTVKEL